jgi:WD repeat-containing protein 35
MRLDSTTEALTSGFDEAMKYAEEVSHPRIWKLIAESALEAQDFQVAQKAFIRSGDFHGIQFVKRLMKVEDVNKQKAEVMAYFGNFDQAERAYLDLERKDLAIDLRIRLGDWFRVSHLVKASGAGDDAMFDKANDNIGEHYFERRKW